MKLRIITFMLTLFFAGLLSCQQSDTVGGVVEFYVIESFNVVDGTQQIDESSVITTGTPLIRYSDIVSYSANDHTFQISSRAANAIESLPYHSSRIAFAVKVNGETIYTGYFWPGFLSLSCDWVTVDPILVKASGELTINLGYPGVPATTIPDRRNDNRLLRILQADNKLQ